MKGLKHIAAVMCGFVVLAVGQVASAQTGYTQTRFPIVLAHGLLGFDSIAGVSYFFQVPEALQQDGATVFVTNVSAGNSSEVRGEQLLRQVEDIVAITGSGKVNLIGHSQGGLDVRYVAAMRPDLVASVTTVAGVHQGSPVADIVRGLEPEGSPQARLLNPVLSALTGLIDLAAGNPQPQDLNAALDSLTSAGAASFNQRFPAGLPSTPCGDGPARVNGINFYSWSGVGSVTTVIDPTDALLAVTSLSFFLTPNDGLVGACDAHLGRVIRDNYFQNHLDEVNQLFGLVSGFEASPMSLFRQQANRLRNAGL